LTEENIKKRMDKLREEIQEHRYSYYVLEHPKISDAQYDRLKIELEQIEKEHPELGSPEFHNQFNEKERSTKGMNVNKGKSNLLLGFLALHETSSHDGYLGAILVTDFQGIPQEFRCTHPVKPTILQRPLYGEALESYIGVNLCGIPLIESIQNKPSLIVVHKEFLLGVRTASSCPAIFVRRAGEAIDIKASDSSDKKLKRERIDCPTGRFQPLVLTPHFDFNEDITSAREILGEIFSYLDPIEPFERMLKAIEVLGKQDKRFQ
jgi:hypothetical protein